MSPYTAALHVLITEAVTTEDLERRLGELVPNTVGRPSAEDIIEQLKLIKLIRQRDDGRYEVTP